jgi:hypothetical protein
MVDEDPPFAFVLFDFDGIQFLLSMVVAVDPPSIPKAS